MNYKLYLVIILGGLVGIFIIQNIVVVDIQFLIWSFQAPRSLLVITVLVIGIIIGWFLHSYLRYRSRRRSG